MTELPPNHHADYRQFGGLFGYLAGLTMILGRGADAKLIADLADVGPDDAVLDIGCGPGVAAREAATRGAQVIGLDPSPQMLRLARILGSGPDPNEIRWMEGTAEQLDLDSGSFSCCWSLASVHHWKNLDRAVAEVARVLRPGGRFLAVERRSEPGAKGVSSHGWTRQQADSFATLLSDADFGQVEVTEHRVGRRDVIIAAGSS